MHDEDQAMTEDLGEILRRASIPSFETIGALMSVDERSPLADEEFDKDLWLLVCRRIRDLESIASLPKPVLDYYASRLMEWEVANGGFPQAAYNIPELFAAAADGYDAIGHPAAAATIRRALVMSKEETGIVAKLKKRRASIGAILKSFK
jgi:hypothetical protein